MNIELPFGIAKSTGIDALRLAIQSAVAATITYIGMSSFQIPEIFLGILSAVLIVSPSIGDTFNQAKERVLSTLVGCLIGFLFVSFMPWGVGTAVSLCIIMFIMNGISGFRPDWRYGVVGALAIALGSESDALTTSLDRTIAILLGVAIGVIVSFTIWPDRAEKRALRYLRKALTAASDRFEIAIENTRKEENTDTREVQNNYHKNIDLAEQAAAAIRFMDAKEIRDQIELTKKLYNSILIIHRVAEQSTNDVTDGEAGIEEDSVKLKEWACKLTRSLANETTIEDKQLSKLSTLAETVKENVRNSEEDKAVNALRYTFVFGMFEIKDSIEALVQSFKTEKKQN